VISASKPYTEEDLLRLHATLDDEVVVFNNRSLAQCMETDGSFLLYIVDNKTLICPGRIPSECVAYGYDNKSRFFLRVTGEEADGASASGPEASAYGRTSGQYLPTMRADASASGSTDPNRRSGKNLPTRSLENRDHASNRAGNGIHSASLDLGDRSRSPAGTHGIGHASSSGIGRTPPPNVHPGDHPPGLTPQRAYPNGRAARGARRSIEATIAREIAQTARRVAIHQEKWRLDPNYRRWASSQGRTFELHQPGSVPPWRAENADDRPPIGNPWFPPRR
jgi:hypothetical protein